MKETELIRRSLIQTQQRLLDLEARVAKLEQPAKDEPEQPQPPIHG